MAAKGKQGMPVDERLDEVEWMLEQGATVQEIATAMDVRAVSLLRMAERKGRRELAITLREEANYERYGPRGRRAS